jgi:hypothetical protein
MESTLEDQGLSCSPRFWEGSGDALATVSTHPRHRDVLLLRTGPYCIVLGAPAEYGTMKWIAGESALPRDAPQSSRRVPYRRTDLPNTCDPSESMFLPAIGGSTNCWWAP